jgi:hypothetical protein
MPQIRCRGRVLTQTTRRGVQNFYKIDLRKCVHVRRMAFVGSEDPGQEWETASQYQIASMAYAAGAAHCHNPPAMSVASTICTYIEPGSAAADCYVTFCFRNRAKKRMLSENDLFRGFYIDTDEIYGNP